MKSSRNTARQLFGLTLTLVGLLYAWERGAVRIVTAIQVAAVTFVVGLCAIPTYLVLRHACASLSVGDDRRCCDRCDRVPRVQRATDRWALREAARDD